MKIEIFHLTQLSAWEQTRNHIVVMYNRQTLVSQPLSFIKFKDRYRLSKLLKLNFIDLLKFVTNYYTKYDVYRHYELLWVSSDIAEVIPFLEIICKDFIIAEHSPESIINSIADQI